MRCRPALTSVVLLLAVLAGCGGGNGDKGAASATPMPAAALPTDPVEVTRAWADAVRVNDIGRASALFALPVLVENGPPRLRLQTREQVRAFNASFPCGASFVRARRLSRGRVLTTYTLTERPGAPQPCGSTAVGARAGVLFTIRDGRIVRWIRADPEAGPAQTPRPQV